MSGRRDGAGAASQSVARQNEYFVPRDGIDREVITADICRYLGNDALVRPGTYTDPSTGQLMQGYRVTAYRALTSAMIQDLKNDSARWEQERRSHSGARYGDSSSRFGNGSAPAQYETSASPYPKASSRDSYEVVPRYPGNDAPGYSGAGSGGPPPNFQYDNRQAQYSNPGYSQPSSFAPPAQDNRYNQQPPPGNSFPQGSYGNPVYHPDGGGAPYMDVGAHRPARFQDTRMASNAYSAQPSGGQYYGQGQYTGGQPIDPMYGRGNNFSNTQPEYSSSQAQPGYEYPSTPAQFDGATAAPLPRGTTSSPTAAPAQTGTSGPSHSHSHRHRDRDTRDGSYSKSERSRRPPQ